MSIGTSNALVDDATNAFWMAYTSGLPSSHIHKFLPVPNAWSFGDNPRMADELGDLVMRGMKTATCSRYTGGNLLKDAGLSILLNGKQQPLCLIDTYEITVRRFCDIDDAWASAEGEGDLSLTYWREAHWKFFNRESRTEGYTMSENMLLACERFKVIYKPRRY